MTALPKQHTINSLLNDHHSKKAIPYHMATSLLMSKQWSKIKSPIIDINSYLNEVLSSFDSLNKELSSGFYLIDAFSHQFYFLSVNQKDSDTLRTHHNRLDNIYEDSHDNQDTILVITDANIKNNVATLVSYI